MCVCVDIMEYSGSPRVLYTTDQENLLISWLKPTLKFQYTRISMQRRLGTFLGCHIQPIDGS